MLRLKLPRLKVVFLALEEDSEHVDGLGEFLPTPLDPNVLVDVVGRLLLAAD